VADVLSGGPAPGPGRPRRRVLVAGGVAVAAVAALLAVRSTPGAPEPRPTPTVRAAPTGGEGTPAPPVPTPVGESAVVSVAVGRRHAYALVAECDRAAVRACAYRLHRRELDAAAWGVLPLRMESRSTVGVFPVVTVSGDDVVTVVESPGGRVYSSLDGFTPHQLAGGPALESVPADGILCTTCRGEVTVLEPATGRLRPLRAQPAFADGQLQSAQQRGRVLWAVSSGRTGVQAAVSVDRGRSWRTQSVPIAPNIADLQLVVGPGGSAYLLCLTLAPGGGSRLAGVWTVGAPGRRWTRLPGPVPRGVRSALVSERGLLIADFGGTVWELRDDGSFGSLPDPGPTRPADLAAGGGALVVATPRGGIPDPLVLTSADGGDSWQSELL
jgi:hypothetical protein